MLFLEINKNRIYIRENQEEILENNGTIIQYIGFYYTISNNQVVEKIVPFIGEIVCERFYHRVITGIYVKPLFLYQNKEWYRITNYREPYFKYFFYPHLLSLPHVNEHINPNYTTESIQLVKTDIITVKTIELEVFQY